MVSQLKVNEIIKQSGSSITIGEDGDSITFPSTGTASGIFTNTPIALGYQSSDQSLTKASSNRIINWTTTLDTDSAFDTSTSRFTVPTNKAGKYFINWQLAFDGDSSGNTGYDLNRCQIFVNGAETLRTDYVREPQIPYGGFPQGGVLNLSASDYVEFFFYPDRGGGTAGNTMGESVNTWFQIFRLSA